MTLPASAYRKPILDENGFQQLLAAAYVLQQHNDSVGSKGLRLDNAALLSQIEEIQSVVRSGEMDREATAVLIADRLRKMTDAAGVSIAISEDGFLKCVAESGVRTEAPGGCIAANSLVPTERLRNGKQFQSADAQRDVRLDIALCRERGVGSLLAAPIPRGDGIAGLVELRWSKPDAFYECDIRTCQLMAGLLGELIERENETSDVAGDSQQLLPPQTGSQASVPPKNEPTPSPVEKAAESLAAECRVCGRPFGPHEAFCGNCSMPRVSGAPAEDLQSKWASMWFMRQAHETTGEKDRADVHPVFTVRRQAGMGGGPPKRETGFDAEWQREKVASAETPGPLATVEKKENSIWNRAGTRGVRSEDNASARGSAPQESASPGDNLRQILQAGFSRLRTRHRVALVAGGLVLALILWGVWPSQSSSRLTWFESMLVELGLAEAPARAPSYAGNPDVQVWVDVHTALYYCPGSDLYGKTPGGRFSSQRDAQQDQFEPATRAVCE